MSNFPYPGNSLLSWLSGDSPAYPGYPQEAAPYHSQGEAPYSIQEGATHPLLGGAPYPPQRRSPYTPSGPPAPSAPPAETPPCPNPPPYPQQGNSPHGTPTLPHNTDTPMHSELKFQKSPFSKVQNQLF